MDNPPTTSPLFLAVGFHKPHIPLKYPREFADLYPLSWIQLPLSRSKPTLMPEVAWNPWNDIRRRDDVADAKPSFPFGPLTPDDFQRTIRQSYFAAISYVDDQFGRLMSGISTIDPSFFEDVVVVVTSDHGWSLGEHGEWSKYSNFDVATRVPLMVYDSPSIQRRRINDSAAFHFPHLSPFADLSFGDRGSRDDDDDIHNDHSGLTTNTDGIEGKISAQMVDGSQVDVGMNLIGRNQSRFRSSSKSFRVASRDFVTSDHVVELVDLFPTIAELAMNTQIPPCPSDSEAKKVVILCTEGRSFASALRRGVDDAAKSLPSSSTQTRSSSSSSSYSSSSSSSSLSASSSQSSPRFSFSQFPRPGIYPTKSPDSDQPKMSQITVMGYSIRRATRLRYAEWIRFDNVTLLPDFSRVYAKELYDHGIDEEENVNVVAEKKYRGVVDYLAWELRRQFSNVSD